MKGRVLTMEMYAHPQPVERYLDIPLSCSCGRTHYVPIKAVEIGPGAINRITALVRERGCKHPYILCDEITYGIAGKRCEALLRADGADATAHILRHTGFDEATLGEIVVSIPADCDLMIGVGTGSITDMTRFASYKLKLPCFTVATGAPMDGFAASIGILNVNNLKLTLPAHCSEAIIGDTDILRTAPYRMTVAGFGDLIGKLSCLNDWKLARIINGEHYCPRIAALVEDCVGKVMAESKKIKDRDAQALGAVMNGLVLSGAAISLYGDSRPASGAEHHMSHFWETIYDQRGQQHAMHGEQVAVGTVLVLMLIEELLKCAPDFERARAAALAYDPAEWEAQIRRVYGAAAQEILELEKKAHKNDTQGRLHRIDSMRLHWSEITAQLSSLPSSGEIRAMLGAVNCPCTPMELGIDDKTLKDTFLYCKEVRPRYTVFQLVWDLELMDELSDRVIERLHQL